MMKSDDVSNDKVTSPLHIVSRIKKIQTPMQDVQDMLVKILRQYRAADKVGISLGVIDAASSFSDHLRWGPIVTKLDEKNKSLGDVEKSQLRDFMNYLESTVNSFEKKVIVNIQKGRDHWMRKVLLLDFISISIITMLITSLVFYFDITVNEEIIISLINDRPLFYSLMLLVVLVLMFISHCYFRSRAMAGMLNDNSALAVGMSMEKALQKNARLRHSIFRPMPVGWNLMQKIRVSRIKLRLIKLRQQLDEVISRYPANAESDKAPE